MFATMSNPLMDVPLPKFGSLIEDDPFAPLYSDDEEEEHDQWQLWQEQSFCRRRQQSLSLSLLRKSPQPSLLSDHVDSRVEGFMQAVSPDDGLKRLFVTQDKAGTKRDLLASSSKLGPVKKSSRGSPVARTYSRKAPSQQQQQPQPKLKQKQYNKEASVCSTKAMSESSGDDGSRVGPEEQDGSVDGTLAEGMKSSCSIVRQQKAILQQIESRANKKTVTRPATTWESTKQIYLPPHGQCVTLLPNDRVRQAMERGESIRILPCSGCTKELLVTPDVSLVFCPHCEAFSSLPAGNVIGR